MAQFYTVSNSMRAKDRDGVPKVWESQYGNFDVWNLYFENDDIKYQVNKKEGFEGFTKGQQLYGTKTESTYGGRFKQEQAPDGEYPAQSGSQSAPKAASNTDGGCNCDNELVVEMLTYMMTLLEDEPGFQSSRDKKETDIAPTDIDEAPIDLSDLPF